MYRRFILLYISIHIIDATTSTLPTSTTTKSPTNVYSTCRTTHKAKSYDVPSKEMGMVNITRQNFLFLDMKKYLQDEN